MGNSDVIFETAADLIDESVHYYDQNELLDIVDNEDIVQVIEYNTFSNRHKIW